MTLSYYYLTALTNKLSYFCILSRSVGQDCHCQLGLIQKLISCSLNCYLLMSYFGTRQTFTLRDMDFFAFWQQVMFNLSNSWAFLSLTNRRKQYRLDRACSVLEWGLNVFMIHPLYYFASSGRWLQWWCYSSSKCTHNNKPLLILIGKKVKKRKFTTLWIRSDGWDFRLPFQQ